MATGPLVPFAVVIWNVLVIVCALAASGANTKRATTQRDTCTRRLQASDGPRDRVGVGERPLSRAAGNRTAIDILSKLAAR
jgi:hypothetical protein